MLQMDGRRFAGQDLDTGFLPTVGCVLARTNRRLGFTGPFGKSDCTSGFTARLWENPLATSWSSMYSPSDLGELGRSLLPLILAEKKTRDANLYGRVSQPKREND